MSARAVTKHVLEALRGRHPQGEGEWLFYREAWNIDAYVIRCWRGGIGQRRIAYEVKASRADFRREIAKPEKRAGALERSHQMFFACPEKLISKDEVPPECGLVWVTDKGTTRLMKKASIRIPRDFTHEEFLYLARLPMFRDGQIELERKARGLKSENEYLRDRLKLRDGSIDALTRALVRMSREALVEGTYWVGTWSRSWDRPEEENVPVVIQKVTWYGDDSLPSIEVVRLDKPELEVYARRSFVLAEEFFARYRPATSDNQAVLDALLHERTA